MKEGKNLMDLAAELMRQKDAKKDFIADTRELEILRHGGDAVRYGMKVNGHGVFDISEHAHGQIAARVGIPQKYYDRMATDQPELLKNNVETWFNAKPERRMIRTLDGRARAFLSDRYRTLDNFDLAEAVLPILNDADGIQIVSTEVTENRLYLKAVFPKIQGEVRRGDVVQSGIVVTNSEIGLSSLKVEPLIYRLVCKNGMIAADHTLRKFHVGRNADAGEAAYEVFRDETLQADDRAFWMKVQDVVRSSLNEAVFGRILETMQEATEGPQLADPVKSVEILANRLGFNQAEHNSVLMHLLGGRDLSRWGAVNAITAASQELPSYDRATDFERLGGHVLVLPANDWRELAEAA